MAGSEYDGKKRGKDGGAEGVRTPDLLNAIQALYQLSYDPIQSERKCKARPSFVKTILTHLLRVASARLYER